jgi:outer membrane protein TolC
MKKFFIILTIIASLSAPAFGQAENPDPATGLAPGEKADPKAPAEAAAQSGIESVIARMRADDQGSGDPYGRTLTLKDAIRIAMMNNRSIQIQEEEVAYAKGNILYATSAFLPQVNAEYTYAFNSSVFYSDSLPGHRVDTRVYSGFKNDNAAGFTAQETVYNGGANVATLKQANIDLKIQTQTLRAAKLDIEFETKRLYYGLLLAYETKRIAQDLVDQAQAHYEDVLTMFGQGTSSKFDVLQSKVKVSTLIPQLVAADNSVEIIKVDLKKLLVINLRDPIRLDGRLEYKKIGIEEDEFLGEAYRNRPEMIIKLLGVDLNKWAIEFAKAGWLPTVNANANYMYRTDNLNNLVNPGHNLWSIGVTASMPLFDGFATKAKVDEARARYNQARLQKDDFVDTLAVDVRSACLDLRKAYALIEAQQDSEGEAAEALRLSEVRFANGVGINLDVFDSEVSLAQVKQSLAQATYDSIMAKAQLDRLRGREYGGDLWQ